VAKLGEILVEMRACTREQVQEGLENQVIFGGRLGTNLLEIGHLDEPTLARALGVRHSLPCLHGNLQVDPAALPLVRPELVDRHQVVPYLAQDRKLALLVCDPNDLQALDEVAFATGKRVHPIVVPEARMWVLMRQLYGIHRQLRGIEVAFGRLQGRGAGAPPARPAVAAGPDLMDESAFEALYQKRLTSPAGDDLDIVDLTDEVKEAAQAPPSPPAAAPSPAEREAVLAALQREEVGRPPPGPAFTPLPAAPPPVVPEPERTPLGFAEAGRLLEGVGDRDAIARTVLRYALSRFKRALLLTVQRGVANGWEGMGEGLDRASAGRINVKLGAPGALTTVVSSRAHFLGPLQKTEQNLRFLKALGGGVPQNAFVLPILTRGRVVNLLYADNGRGGLVGGGDLGELLILATKIANSYDALITRSKAGTR